MSRAIAFLAGMGTGYLNADRQKKQDERQAKFDKITFDRAGREEADWNRQQTKASDIAAAAAPVKVEQAVDLPDNRDIGQPGETAPVPFYRAGARRFAEQGLADAEAATQNTPAMANKRMYSAVGKYDPLEARRLESTDLQADAAKVTLAKAQQEQAAKAFDDGVVKALYQGPQALAAFMSESHADGKSGAVKFSAKINSDGTWQMMRLTPDGKQQPFGQVFTDDDNGRAMAGFMLSQAVPPRDKMAHALQQKKVEQDQANSDREFGLKKGLIDSQVKENTAKAGYYDGVNPSRVAIAEAKAEKPLRERMSEIDGKTFDGLQSERTAITARIGKIEDAVLKAQTDSIAPWDEKSPQAISLREQIRQQKEKLGALAIRERSITERYSAASAPVDRYGLRAPGGGSTTTRPATPMEAIQQDMARTGVQAADLDIGGAKSRLGATGPAAIPGSGGKQAPPEVAEAASPGIGSWAADLARQGMTAIGNASTSARAQGTQYQAIARRVQEAASGSAPLTPQEIAIARQFGIVPSR